MNNIKFAHLTDLVCFSSLNVLSDVYLLVINLFLV